MLAIASTFKSGEPSLRVLLDEIHKGSIQLPDFQRGWVWDDDHIRSLIASVSLSYPIGALLTLETGGAGVRFRPRLVEGVRLGDVPAPQLLILDGQQNMTSLYLSLRSGSAVATTTDKGKPIDRVYYLDMARAVSPAEDRLDAVVSIPPARKLLSDFNRKVDLDVSTPELEYRTGYFSPWRCCSTPSGCRHGGAATPSFIGTTKPSSISLTRSRPRSSNAFSSIAYPPSS